MAKSVRVAFGRARTRLLGIVGGSNHPMGDVVPSLGADLWNDQKGCGGNHLDVVFGRVVRDFESAFAHAARSKFTHRGHPRADSRELLEFCGGRLLESENPSFSTVQVFARSHEWSQKCFGARLSAKKRIALSRVENVVPVVDRLRSTHEFRHCIDRFGRFAHREVWIGKAGSVEEVGR